MLKIRQSKRRISQNMTEKKRILLKLSGEMLLGSQASGIDPQACSELAKTIQYVRNQNYEVAVVIGAGNLFRGKDLNALGIKRTPADQIGMLATIINGLAIQQALETLNCPAKVMSALECPKAVENYNWAKALQYLSDHQVVIFTGGTGSPYFTTDTAAALRASEIEADFLLKATKVDGVYDQDPQKNKEAKRYTSLSYSKYLADQLQVMDSTAVALCMNNHIPIVVFDMKQLGKVTIENLVRDTQLATIIKD